MSLILLKIFNSDGSVLYIDDKDLVQQIFNSLPKNIKWKKTGKISELRSKYFAMLKQLNIDVNTGYSNTDLHEYIKPLILKKFYDYPQYFKTGIPEYSTRNLTIEGWQATIEQLKVIALDVFKYTFKEIG